MDSLPPANIFRTLFLGSYDGSYGAYVIAAVVAIVVLYALFILSFFEYSICSLNTNELKQIAGSKSEEYKWLKKALKDPSYAISSLLVGYYLTVICAIISLSFIIGSLLHNTACPTNLYVVIEGVITVLSIVFVGDVLTGVARKYKKLSFLYAISGEVWFIIQALSPLSWFIRRFTSIAEKRFEVKSEHRLSVNELTETLNTEKVQQNEEKEILQGIVSFGNISVDEIMRPRVDIVDVDINSSYAKVLKIIKDSEYSRLPVFEDTIDNIKGVLYVKDLLQYLNEDDKFEWQHLIRPPYFVPESKKIDELLKEFQSKHIHMAIVVDEFGGTAGIATLENILEVIVGDIIDEHDEEQKMYTKLDKRNYIIDAKIPLTDFFKMEKVDKELFSSIDTDADTLAGLMLEIKGSIPAIGDRIEHEGYIFTIVSADSRRIKKIKLQIPEDLV